MAYEEIQDLGCETTIQLGGNNKKTGKPNPGKIEGYYLGSREVNSKLSPTGKALIHVFQTPKGNVGVWGKTDLNRKLQSVNVGTMTLASFDKMIPTGKGNDMYSYRVQVDKDNVIDASASDDYSASDSSYTDAGSAYGDEEEETPVDADAPAPDEIVPPRAKAPQAARQPDAAAVARAKALLNGSRSRQST